MTERYPFLPDCVLLLAGAYLATMHLFITPEMSVRMREMAEAQTPRQATAATETQAKTDTTPEIGMEAGSETAPPADPRDVPLRFVFPKDVPAEYHTLNILRLGGVLVYQLDGGQPLARVELEDAMKDLAIATPKAKVRIRTAVEDIEKGDLAEITSLGDRIGLEVFVVAGEP